jgi:hypothetical protein
MVAWTDSIERALPLLGAGDVLAHLHGQDKVVQKESLEDPQVAVCRTTDPASLRWSQTRRPRREARVVCMMRMAI